MPDRPAPPLSGAASPSTTDAPSPLRELPGIGPARARALAEQGFLSAADVVYELPTPAPPPPPLIDAGPLPSATAIRVHARLLGLLPRSRGPRARIVEGLIERGDGLRLRIRFFNAPWVRKQLTPLAWYRWQGRLDGTGTMLLHPRFEHCPTGVPSALPEDGGLVLEYRAITGFSTAAWQRLVAHAFAAGPLEDPMGEVSGEAYRLLLMQAHHPPDEPTRQRAVRELARRELTALAWRLQELLPEDGVVPGRRWAWNAAHEQRARSWLPYVLTPGQEDALAVIRDDMRRSSPMCRLLQGEVGSGKTAIALLAALAVVEEGAQAWLLAPTTVLAEQHFRFVTGCVQAQGVRVALLTAGCSAAERARVRALSAGGGIDILIGTHALLQQGMLARTLGLVVIDEQHKFGVAQRMAAVAKAGLDQHWRPDLLLLSATPIPRTLALSIYGDLPVSRIVGRPPGRGRVSTDLLALQAPSQLVDLITPSLSAGGQAFVVCARRELDGHGFSAREVHRLLARQLGTRVALLHGDLTEAEKSLAMGRFIRGDATVLVATTVIEVGIDVPQATILVVLEAERFGLAQLHQLRGRLARGDRDGRCVLAYTVVEPPPRLALLVASSDGLVISEADLAERGPGDLLGTLQHGGFALKIADVVRDLDLLHAAHEQVRAARRRGERCPAGLRSMLPLGSVPSLTA